MTRLTINAERLLGDLKALSTIGRTPQGGISRPAMSPADVQGRTWFKEQVTASGLEFRQDGAGNLSAILPAEGVDKTILIGSHLDTVPNGGAYDGALGVLAALEVLRTVHEAGLKLPFHLEAVSFTDEEGHLLPVLGSRAVAGLLSEADLLRSRGGPTVLQEGLARLNISPATLLSAHRDNISEYFEVHIEQGTRLEEAGIDVGVVTSIVGIRSRWIRFSGQAAHAGTTPMSKRADALWGVAAFVGAARDLVMSGFPEGVMNVGKLEVAPGAFNIVPAEVRFALEFRHGEQDQLDKMEQALLETAQQAAQQYSLQFDTQQVGDEMPAVMSQPLMQAIEAAADDLRLSHVRLASFAGHDAMCICKIAPSAMIFVPSVKGISHSPYELTHSEDIINAATILLQLVTRRLQPA